jgi:hypothetical protein
MPGGVHLIFKLSCPADNNFIFPPSYNSPIKGALVVAKISGGKGPQFPEEACA